jgi:hypothetical protein
MLSMGIVPVIARFGISITIVVHDFENITASAVDQRGFTLIPTVP